MPGAKYMFMAHPLPGDRCGLRLRSGRVVNGEVICVGIGKRRGIRVTVKVNRHKWKTSKSVYTVKRHHLEGWHCRSGYYVQYHAFALAALALGKKDPRAKYVSGSLRATSGVSPKV